ncbi:MAG: NAD(P)-dependent alcohol dehydrogenase [Anaerolineales bacterium]
MKAIVQTRPGPPDVLQLRDVPKPTTGEHDVLIRVHAATVARGDVITRSLPRMMRWVMRVAMGMRTKPIPGQEFAGEVVATGAEVSRFSPGDQVFGSTGMSSAGAYAEFVCLADTDTVVPKPVNLSFEEAAVLPIGGTTALHFLRQADIQDAHHALIYGASGSVGTYAVQLAKYFGAKVTGVCGARNADMVRSLGAEEVIDYTSQDYAAGEATYDVVFDAVGKTTAEHARPALTAGGRFVTVRKGLARGTVEDLKLLGEIAVAGNLSPVIDRCYPLERTAEAHAYVEAGHKVGNVVITVVPE